MGQRRRAIAEAARAAGLGELVRIHRGHREGAAITVLWCAVLGGSIPAGIAAVILRSEDSPIWQWPLLAWATLAGVTFLLSHTRRHLVGVAHGGVVRWRRGSVSAATWAEAGTFETDHVCSSGDLRASITQGVPVGAWTRRRITGLTVTVLATAAATWFAAIPIAAHFLLGERPVKTAQFARMCEGGRSFGQAAAYAGSAPHPAVVFNAGSPYWDYAPVPDDEAAAVQLVGCAVLIGEGKALAGCDYQQGYSSGSTRSDYHLDIYQGRYLVDVYEAQTARHVGSFRLDGAASAECSQRTLIPGSRLGEGQSDRIRTDPDDDSYRSHLASFVDGPPRR